MLLSPTPIRRELHFLLQVLRSVLHFLATGLHVLAHAGESIASGQRAEHPEHCCDHDYFFDHCLLLRGLIGIQCYHLPLDYPR